MPTQLTVRAAKTRASLVRAARTLFERQGYLDTNVTDIAHRARCAHGTFYTYFSSKEEIFSEVIRAMLADFKRISAAEPHVPDPTDVGTLIERSIRGYLRAYEANAGMVAVLEQVATFNPRLAEIRRQTRRFWVDQVTVAIRGMQERGQAHASLDAGYAATALGSMIDRSAYLWNVLGEPYEFEVAVRQLTLLYCAALGLPRHPSTPVQYSRAR
ncbi:MAG: TetR family transcriptional regulator [Ilumatobacteraceae bacterium]|nr:TetR family transcriptional regulator [Ilumatobacteraceae bacterium]